MKNLLFLMIYLCLYDIILASSEYPKSFTAASGDDSGSGEYGSAGYRSGTPTSDTILHEITVTSGNKKEVATTQATIPDENDPNCISGELCGITLSPFPTKVLDIDLDEDSSTFEENTVTEVNNCKLSNIAINKRLRQIEIEQKLQNSRSQFYFTKILEKLEQIEMRSISEGLTKEKYDRKMSTFENQVENIYKVQGESKSNLQKIISSINDLKERDEKYRKESEETQNSELNSDEQYSTIANKSYIDVKFLEMKRFINESSDVMERKFAKKLESTLGIFRKSVEEAKALQEDAPNEARTINENGSFELENSTDETPMNDNENQKNDELDSKGSDYAKVTLCKTCCQEVPLSEFLESQNNQGQFGYVNNAHNGRYPGQIAYASLSEIRQQPVDDRDRFQDEFDIDPNLEQADATEMTPTTARIPLDSEIVLTTGQTTTEYTHLTTITSRPTVEFEKTVAPALLHQTTSISQIEEQQSLQNKSSNTRPTTTLFTFLSSLYSKIAQEGKNSTENHEIIARRKYEENRMEYQDVPEGKQISVTTFDTTLAAETLTTPTTKMPTPKPEKHVIPTTCAEIYRRGQRRSGVYKIGPPSGQSFNVFCDMETDGGGWTVIQRRLVGDVNFTRGWEDYKNGFGFVNGDYWIGLEQMHLLTTGSNRQKTKMSLRVDLKDWSDVSQFAYYKVFRVSNEEKNYRLFVKNYHGNAGNALQYGESYNHNGQGFTTNDRDNDGYTHGNCGQYYSSGWWYNACFAANLNGKYYKGNYRGIQDGIYWGTWYRLNDAATDSRHSFKYVDMKIRPSNFLSSTRRKNK
uniref:uncharacterized protein LOC120328557 isoform X1 n=1 Tax=Styela clava TaxID=7725 RepID=UPI0019397248|nr:uncharacterized protein LOC120328557 isoform X1 [Styela clava]